MPGPRYLDAAKGAQQQTSMSKSRSDILHGKGGGGGTLKGRTSKPNNRAPTVVTLPHDPRFLFPFAVAVGKKVTVQIKSGAEFEGILHGPVLGTKQLHITLKNVRLVKNPRNELNKTLIEKEYYTLIIPSLDFVQMRILDIPNYFHSSKDIDTNGSKKQISHSGSSGSMSLEGSQEERVEVVERVMDINDGEDDIAAFEGDLNRAKVSTRQKIGEYGRELKKWGDDAEDEERINKANIGFYDKMPETTKWNQFEVNKKKFGVETTFNMDPYTSKLDVSKSRYTEEEAERLAAEIEQRPVDPRFHLDDTGRDEEDLEYPVINSHEKSNKQKSVLNNSTQATTTVTEVVKPEKKGRTLTWADAVKGSRQKKQQIISTSNASTPAVTSMANTNTGPTKLTGVWTGGSHKNRLEISHDENGGESSKQLTLTAPIRARNINMRDTVRENGNHLYHGSNTSFNEPSISIIRESRMTMRNRQQQQVTMSSTSNLDSVLNDKQKTVLEEKKEAEVVSVEKEGEISGNAKESVVSVPEKLEEDDREVSFGDEEVQMPVVKEAENQESVNNQSEITQNITSKFNMDNETNVNNKLQKNMAVDTSEAYDAVVEGPAKTTQNFNDYPPKAVNNNTMTTTSVTAKAEVVTSASAAKKTTKLVQGKSYVQMLKEGMAKRAADAEAVKKSRQQQAMASAKTSAVSNQNKNIKSPTSPSSKPVSQEKAVQQQSVETSVTKEETLELEDNNDNVNNVKVEEEDEIETTTAVQQPMSSMVILPDQILPEADSSKEGDHEALETDGNVSHYHDAILNDTTNTNVYYNSVKMAHVTPVVIPGATTTSNDKQSQQQQQNIQAPNSSIVTPSSHHVMNPNAHMFSPLNIASGNNGFVDGSGIENVVTNMTNVGITHQSAQAPPPPPPPPPPAVHSESENKIDRNTYSTFANALETQPAISATPGISVLNISNRVPKQTFRNRQNLINAPETSGLQANVENENELSHMNSNSPQRPRLNHMAKPFYPSNRLFGSANTQIQQPMPPVNEQPQQHYHPQPMPPKEANTAAGAPTQHHPPQHPHNPNMNVFEAHQIPPPPMNIPGAPHPHPHPQQQQPPPPPPPPPPTSHPIHHPHQMPMVPQQHARNMPAPHQGPMNVNQGQPHPPMPPNLGLPPHNANNGQVVTPWPNIPGTGVWHSNVVSNHRNMQSGPHMQINNYMTPAMPGHYPVFVPTPPPPPTFMPNGIQDHSMWAAAAAAAAAAPGGPMAPPHPHAMPGMMEPHPHPQMIYNGFYGGAGGKPQGMNMKPKMTPLPHGKPPGNFGNGNPGVPPGSGNVNNSRSNRNNRRQTLSHGQESHHVTQHQSQPKQHHNNSGNNEQQQQNGQSGMEIVN